MINVLICDDDQNMRKMLRKIVSENHVISNVYITENGIEALEIVQEQTINIALLDIEMPKLNGIETAKLISKISPSTSFIFITAHADYAIDSFAVHPYSYLLKPINKELLNNTLNDLVHEIVPDNQIITIKNGNDILVLAIKNILFYEKAGNKTAVHTIDDEIIWNKTLTEIESILNKTFLRTHQSFIVNTESIKKIEHLGNRSYRIEFKETKKTAYMSRNNYEKMKKIFAIE